MLLNKCQVLADNSSINTSILVRSAICKLEVKQLTIIPGSSEFAAIKIILTWNIIMMAKFKYYDTSLTREKFNYFI